MLHVDTWSNLTGKSATVLFERIGQNVLRQRTNLLLRPSMPPLTSVIELIRAATASASTKYLKLCLLTAARGYDRHRSLAAIPGITWRRRVCASVGAIQTTGDPDCRLVSNRTRREEVIGLCVVTSTGKTRYPWLYQSRVWCICVQTEIQRYANKEANCIVLSMSTPISSLRKRITEQGLER